MGNLFSSDNDLEERGDFIAEDRNSITSGVYDGTIEVAYINESSTGAKTVKLNIKLDDDRMLYTGLLIQSGNSKGNKNYFLDHNGKKIPFVGFTNMQHLAMLSAGIEATDFDIQDRVINIYDFDAEKEVPTEKQVIMDLVGARTKIGVLEVLEDHFMDSSKSITKRNIDKVFDPETGHTVFERKMQQEEAEFITKWSEKNTGRVVDKRKDSKNSTESSEESADTSTPKPKKNLFA